MHDAGHEAPRELLALGDAEPVVAAGAAHLLGVVRAE